MGPGSSGIDLSIVVVMASDVAAIPALDALMPAKQRLTRDPEVATRPKEVLLLQSRRIEGPRETPEQEILSEGMGTAKR